MLLRTPDAPSPTTPLAMTILYENSCIGLAPQRKNGTFLMAGTVPYFYLLPRQPAQCLGKREKKALSCVGVAFSFISFIAVLSRGFRLYLPYFSGL